MTAHTISSAPLEPQMSAPGPAPSASPRLAAISWQPTIAVLIPCLDEAASIAKVVGDFQTALPDAKVFVYDNGSKDATMEVARAAGAIVRREPMRGKGNVVRRMFADVEADVFILVDGDDTYDAGRAPELVEELLRSSLDMINGARRPCAEQAYRRGHQLGNRVLSGLVASIFGNQISDLLSGYRVLSRRFVKSFPALSSGFEIETELSVHALQLRMPVCEIEIAYRERPQGSASKLSTYKDGLRILRTIFHLVKEERPFAFFSVAGAALAAASLALGVPVIIEFSRTGLVPRLPTALLAAAIAILSFMSFGCGLVLDVVSRGRAEAKRLAYLSLPVRFTPIRSDPPARPRR